MRIDIMNDGLWWLDPETLRLHRQPTGAYYRVDLLRLTRSSEVLDTILHEDANGTEDAAVTLSLVRTLNQILRPMDGMCSGGADTVLTERVVRHRVSQFLEDRAA